MTRLPIKIERPFRGWNLNWKTVKEVNKLPSANVLLQDFWVIFKSFVIYLDAFVLKNVREVVLADIGKPSHQARATLQDLSKIVLAHHNVIKNTASLLR